MEKEELSKQLFELLHNSGQSVATAESCTGGAVAAAIVATSGASEYFKGGVVSYCNEVKERLLGVSHDVLEEQTAVCEEVAIEMARGAREFLKTDYAVAITGTAGPGGGTAAIPVGTIWICVSGKTDRQTIRLTEDNGRKANLDNAVVAALTLLCRFIAASQSGSDTAKSKKS